MFIIIVGQGVDLNGLSVPVTCLGLGGVGDGSLYYSLSILLKYFLQIPLKFKPLGLLTAEKGVWVKFEKRVA